MFVFSFCSFGVVFGVGGHTQQCLEANPGLVQWGLSWWCLGGPVVSGQSELSGSEGKFCSAKPIKLFWGGVSGLHQVVLGGCESWLGAWMLLVPGLGAVAQGSESDPSTTQVLKEACSLAPLKCLKNYQQFPKVSKAHPSHPPVTLESRPDGHL